MPGSQYVNSRANLRGPMIKNPFAVDMTRYNSDSHPEFNHVLYEVSNELFQEINGYGGTGDDAIDDYCDKLDVLWGSTH